MKNDKKRFEVGTSYGKFEFGSVRDAEYDPNRIYTKGFLVNTYYINWFLSTYLSGMIAHEKLPGSILVKTLMHILAIYKTKHPEQCGSLNGDIGRLWVQDALTASQTPGGIAEFQTHFKARGNYELLVGMMDSAKVYAEELMKSVVKEKKDERREENRRIREVVERGDNGEECLKKETKADEGKEGEAKC